MSTIAPQDSSEDVNDFLQRIKELGDKRDQEDEERNRLLEEEILKGRAERQARRAERARSISPTKSSPANTPVATKTSASRTETLAQSAKMDSEGRSEAQSVEDAMNSLTGGSTSPMKENSIPTEIELGVSEYDGKRSSAKISPSSAIPSRNSPLSWQRRPISQASDQTRSRPLSIVATENAARSPRAATVPDTPSDSDSTFSREQIAQSLATKDPAWFRQTADRGLHSPAYRRQQVEDGDRSDHGTNSARIQMPGMAQSASGPEKVVDDPVDRSSSPSRTSTLASSGSRQSYQASQKASSGLGSPMPLLPAQRFDPPAESRAEHRGLAMSPTQGRISPERLDRPPSPTKGLGGFVQSAMMKRSDSVNKRWSVQSPAGLSRGNSVASRASIDLGSNGTAIHQEPRPSSRAGEGSPRPSSRPTSSHSNATLTQERPGTSSSMRSSITASTTAMSNDVFVKPSLPISRTQTPTGSRNGLPDSSDNTTKPVEVTPPSSPSKTMDSRRWSPTKSSWLETALNKPESPKPKAVVTVPQQPSWMSEITKAKQKGSADLGRGPVAGPKHEVSIGGLMRSPPPGGLMKPQSLGSVSSSLNSPLTTKHTLANSRDAQALAEQSPSVSATSAITSSPKPSPATDKIKPATPPKKDFRANLKPRQLPSEDNKSNEPEFKNALGQLRRTKTQNYVAPDELKNNITRGKAALNFTGGPKKTERKDEFKEAILKKKEDFKKAQVEGKGVTRSTSGSGPETPLPEAIVKRRALSRSDSNASDLSGQGSSSRPQSVADSPKPSLVKETSAPGRLQAKESLGGKLAGRLNPGLAGLLARGPPAMASDTSRSSSPAQSLRTASVSTSATEPSETGPQLTHMTKSRARGPRRKAPASVPATSLLPESPVSVDPPSQNERQGMSTEERLTGSEPSKQVAVSLTQSKTSDSRSTSPTKESSDPIGSQPTSPRKLDMKRRSQFLQEAPNKIGPVESQLGAPKPLSPAKKANPSEIPMKFEEPSLKPNFASTNSKPTTPLKPSSIFKTIGVFPKIGSRLGHMSLTEPSSIVPSVSIHLLRSSNHHSPTKQNESPQLPNVSVKQSAADWTRIPPTTVQETARAKDPITLPTLADENAAMVGAGLRSSGIQNARPLPTPPLKGTASSGLIPEPPQQTTEAAKSPAPHSSDASKDISDFFHVSKTAAPSFKVDTAALLSTRPDQGMDIKTLRSDLFQMSSDGKKQAVPSHQERILFEGNIYLCTHTFGTPGGQRITQTYFWVGDDVPSAVIEDAEIFARREAKSTEGDLITIRQGKETPEFFNALGGIVIIRRGTANRYDSLAPHVLCGRKHFGQIAFDEVDFSPNSLCSGFPYLISTQSGKSYLWKGKGSGIEELSCARLIGMDFGLTGEIEEIEDGHEHEHAAFKEIFGKGSQIPKSADHWKLKSNYNKYCVRLFRADAASREQITEISPFCWADLETRSIYILDAFFEIYIIVGSAAQSQYSAFQIALVFAQEYGIIAASMEDRPYIPVTTVVLEGVPKDMKSVFRKWVQGSAPTLHKAPVEGSLQRGRSLRVLPLNAALEATQR